MWDWIVLNPAFAIVVAVLVGTIYFVILTIVERIFIK
jgi:hypothetical protein